jgi:hypothetical protein
MRPSKPYELAFHKDVMVYPAGNSLPIRKYGLTSAGTAVAEYAIAAHSMGIQQGYKGVARWRHTVSAVHGIG